MDALLHAHPTTPVVVYIDNLALVQRFDVNLDQDPRGRSPCAARAVWNRIAGIQLLRASHGASTTVAWVHSHVGTQNTKPLVRRRSASPHGGTRRLGPSCACGEPAGHCNAAHRHHVGNEMADVLAADGRGDQKGPDDLALQGEEEYYLSVRGKVSEGDITEDLREAARQARAATMEHSEKATVRRVHAMLTQTCTPTRHQVLKMGVISRRFKVRAVAGMLPTNLHEYKRSREGNEYDYIYGDSIHGGRCVCALTARCTRTECCCSAVEDMTHAMADCSVSEDVSMRG